MKQQSSELEGNGSEKSNRKARKEISVVDIQGKRIYLR